MTLTAGAITEISVGGNVAQLSVAPASGGTGPYTYQWYRSTASGFTPGGGNILSGKTDLTLNDSGLIPNTTYYYKNIVTDTGDSNNTDTSSQEAVTTTAQTQNQNQFAQVNLLGKVELPYNTNTISVQVDTSESGTIYAGAAVKMVDSAGGVPKVILCTAEENEVLGYVNYNIKDVGYVAGDSMEISLGDNVIMLYAAAAVARGVEVVMADPAVHPQLNAVIPASGESGKTIVGWAFDKASGAGELIRVKLKTPSFSVVA